MTPSTSKPSASMRLGERADAEAARVLGAEVLVDDDDRKAEFHALRLLVRPKMERGAGPGPGPTPVGPSNAPGLCAGREAGASPLTPPAAGSAARLGARATAAAAGARRWRRRAPRPSRAGRRPSGVRSRRPHGRFFSAAITRGEREHPADAADADDEHHQHQRPAAADAEHAVVDAEPQRLARRRDAVPARRDEPERRMALLEAAVLERAELERAGTRQHRGRDDPRR